MDSGMLRKNIGLVVAWLGLAFGSPATAEAVARKAPAVAAPTAVRTVLPTPSGDPEPRFALPQLQPLRSQVATARINRALVAAFAWNLEKAPAAPTAAEALKHAEAEYQANGQRGFVGASYEVLYNAHHLLSLALHHEYEGAYPSTSTVHLTFDLRTGQLLALRQLVADTAALRRQWQQAIGRRVAAHLRALPAQYPEADADTRAEVQELLGTTGAGHSLTFKPNEPRFSDFALTRKGLALYHSFDFPHVIQALEPETIYLFPYAELKKWLKATGPLAFQP
jgi:hypothetical protein